MWMTDKGDVKMPQGAEFEVFLNFRGSDTRQTFADCLYHFMDIAGIRVFRDEEEIRKSEEIGGELLDAIKSCKIYLPIFSMNYASSSWCLRELAEMMKCQRETNEKLLAPIFYDVSTADVKLKTGLYRHALETHKNRFALEHNFVDSFQQWKVGWKEIQQWEEALIEAASFKGWDLKNRG